MAEIFWAFVLAILIFITVGIFLGISAQGKADDLSRTIEADHSFVSPVDSSCIAVSFRTQRIIVGGKRRPPRIAAFRQILKADILQEDETAIASKGGSLAARAVVGGLVAGPMGAAVGALTSQKRSIQSMKRLALRVVTDSWTEQITFWDSRGTNHQLPNSTKDFLIEQADDFYGFLLSAMNAPDSLPTSSPGLTSLTVQNSPEVAAPATPSASIDPKKLAERIEAAKARLK